MERGNPLHLRVFLSSPDDVAEERRMARQVLDQLPRKPHAVGKVTIEVIAWDDLDAPVPMVAGETPQVSVNRLKGRPADCDLTVVILWGKIGTPPCDLFRPDGSRYESGTVWEYEDALQSQKEVLIYCRTEKPRPEIDDPEYEAKRQQYEAVKKFFERFKSPDGSLKGGINSYETPQDFRENFEKHLESLIRARLDDQEAREMPYAGRATASPAAGPMWTWPRAWDFSGYINEKRRAFVGREWLFEKVETWIKSDGTQALLMLADYGVGKSAFLAELVHRNPGNGVVAHHFCHHDTAETLNPATFVRSLAAQLARTFADYKAHVENDAAVREWLDKADTDSGSAFERAIIGPLARMPVPAAGATCIIIDALDESLEFDPGEGRKRSSHIIGLLASRAARLPAWLKVLASSRRRHEVLQKIQQSFRTQIIDAEDAHNLEDIRRYVIQRCKSEPLAEKLGAARKNPEWAASLLADQKRSGGKFLYVSRVLKDIASGALDVIHLTDLPPGMDGFYADAFDRRFGVNGADYVAVRPLLGVLAAAREPLLRTDLAQILDQEEDRVREALAQVEDFLTIRNKRYAFDHYSLAQWLTEENDQGFPRAGRFAVSLSDAQQRLNRWALKQVYSGCAHESVYLARHLPAHLGEADRTVVYRKLLLDYRWLETRLREAGINALLNDWPAETGESTIAAVSQALRQAAHILGHEGTDWTGADQLASQLLARLQDSREPGIRPLLCDACAVNQRTNKCRLWPMTASLRGSIFLLRTLGGHSGWVNALTFLSDGRLASGSDDRTIKLWNPTSGECECTLEGHRAGITALARLPDGRLASGSRDQTIKIWNLTNGECERTLQGHRGMVTALTLLPTGLLASGSWDRTIKLWHLASGDCEQTIDSHSAGVTALALLPDGRLASGSKDQTIKLWNVAKGDCEQTFKSHSAGITALVLLPGGRLASGSRDRAIKLWDLSSGQCEQTLKGHSRSVTSLTLLPAGRLASGSDDRTIKVWNLFSGQCEQTLKGHSKWVGTLALLPDGRLASGSGDQTIMLWDPARGECEQNLKGHNGGVTVLAPLSDGRLASGSRDRTIRLWNLGSKDCERTLEGHSEGVTALGLLPNGRLASGSWDRTIRLWNLASGDCERILEGHSEGVTALTLLPDGRLASGSKDRTIKLWNLSSGQCEQTLKDHSSGITVLILLSDGRLASGSGDGTIKFWNATSGECAQILKGHGRSVTALILLPDGRLASGSKDQTIKLWNTTTGLCEQNLEGRNGWVRAIALLPKGELACGLEERTIRIWSWFSQPGFWTNRVAFVSDSAILTLVYWPSDGILVGGDKVGHMHFLKLEGGLSSE